MQKGIAVIIGDKITEIFCMKEGLCKHPRLFHLDNVVTYDTNS